MSEARRPGGSRLAARWGVVVSGVWLALAGCAQAQAPRPTPPPRAAELAPVPGRDAILIELARAIHTAAQRRDTNHRVFHGCLDWHSAVHAHWALLRVARVTGHARDEAAWVEARLSADGVAHEAALLRERPRFEDPYGRAWFLRLALEFEAWARPRGIERPARLRAMADEVAAGLLGRYARRGFDPAEDTYRSSAWALVQLHAWLSHRQDWASAAHVEAWIAQGTDAADDLQLSFGEDAVRAVFFSRYGNWAYAVAHTQPPARLAAFLKAQPPGDLASFAPIQGRPHHLGVVWSRAWALRALARRAPSPALRRAWDHAYHDHVRRGLAQHVEHAQDFKTYGHWVPQFAVYALTEGERPRFFH